MLDGLYVVKPIERLIEEFDNLTSEEGFEQVVVNGVNFTKSMLTQLPLGNIIKIVDDTWVTDSGSYRVVEEMLLGPYLEYKQPCEASDNGKLWKPAKFITYCPGNRFPVVVYNPKDGRTFYALVRRQIVKPVALTEKKYKLYSVDGVFISDIMLCDDTSGS